jgi:hypothetical protein
MEVHEMSRRRWISLVLLIVVIASAQVLLVALKTYAQKSFDGTAMLVQPALLALASVLVGVLLHLFFAEKGGRRLPLPFFLLFSVAALFVAFFTNVYMGLPFLNPVFNLVPFFWHTLLLSDHASVFAGVFLGALIANQLRRNVI